MPAANYADLSILSTKEKVGRCRICGESGPLSLEHVIPRSAGGGEKMQLYNTSDLITNPEKAYGKSNKTELLHGLFAVSATTSLVGGTIKNLANFIRYSISGLIMKSRN